MEVIAVQRIEGYTLHVAMGMLITVTEKKGARHGTVRFETNRAITGMGHERYSVGDAVLGQRPPDELARRLFALGTVDTVHIHGNQITVELAPGGTSDGMSDLIEDLFIHYTPGVQPSIIG
ncbi:MAG: hypothetical protein ACKVP6_11755 [Mycobacterium sp.]